MARRPKATPKEPKAPIVYENSESIAKVAADLVRSFPTHFGWVNSFAVGYIIVRGGRRRVTPKIDVGARLRKVTGVYHGITGLDAVVEITDWRWEDQDTAQRQEALVAHVLSHGLMTEKGALQIQPHDLEEFRWVVAQYGAWQPEIVAFGEQLALFADRGPVGNGTEPRQEPIESFRTTPEDDAPTPISKKRSAGDQPPAVH